MLAQGSYGTIKGKLAWGGATAPVAKVAIAKGKADKDPTVCAANGDVIDNRLVVDPKTMGVRYAFAYLVTPKGSNPEAVKALLAKTPKVEVDQKGCDFLPHSVGMHIDQTLVFKSSDAVNHNIHLTSFNNGFNSICAPNGVIEKKRAGNDHVLVSGRGLDALFQQEATERGGARATLPSVGVLKGGQMQANDDSGHTLRAAC